MRNQITPAMPVDTDSEQPVFDRAPDLRHTSAQPLAPEVATQIEAQLRGIDTVRIRVLGDDPSSGQDIAAHLVGKGYAVDLILAQRMVPPPLSRHVFRFQGRTAILTIAPDLP